MSWAPGDLAVCVDDAANEWSKPDPLPIVRGRIYCVAKVGLSPIRKLPMLGLVELPADSGRYHGFVAERFRKIEPAEPCFIEAMHSLRPKVEA
ncbi:MAG TPA: hypothetical protein VF503_00155 [Sphingobium sp.]|uniref:hypothetical protein n=1 Tax=Sphingobium sp. TaxID=1912891 RepID=UPI002ED342FF